MATTTGHSGHFSPVVAALVAAGFSGPACTKSNCDLGAELANRAGSGARDCGHATVGDGGTDKVDSCAVDEFTAKKPFFATYDRRGKGSPLVFGIAGDAAGKVTFLVYDSTADANSDSLISGNVCNDPSVNDAVDRDPETTPPIACSSATPLGLQCGTPRR